MLKDINDEFFDNKYSLFSSKIGVIRYSAYLISTLFYHSIWRFFWFVIYLFSILKYEQLHLVKAINNIHSLIFSN